MHTTSRIGMVRPAAFGYNDQTAADNHYQVKTNPETGTLQEQALLEFDNAVKILRSKHIEVLILQDDQDVIKPDAIFPNNWFICRAGLMEIFPMYAQNRRAEKRRNLIEDIARFTGSEIIDNSQQNEALGQFLEGTGSMIFDHINKSVYACLSERTSKKLLTDYSSRTGYKLICFNAGDENGRPVYHTNVILSIGRGFAVICDEAIADINERKLITEELRNTGHELISITLDQVKKFCGNILELKGTDERPYIVMSHNAFDGFTKEQKETLERYGEIIHIPIPVIEKTGGGSLRCMIAELF